jgi:hypothetical protein
MAVKYNGSSKTYYFTDSSSDWEDWRTHNGYSWENLMGMSWEEIDPSPELQAYWDAEFKGNT